MSKYDPLRDHLTSRKDAPWRVTFAEIETILGFPLPRSAYSYPAWWSNDATGHSHSLAWLDAGWKTEQVDVAGRSLTFRKHEEPRPAPDSGTGAAVCAGRLTQGTLHGSVPGVIQMVAGTDLTRPTGAAGPQKAR